MSLSIQDWKKLYREKGGRLRCQVSIVLKEDEANDIQVGDVLNVTCISEVTDFVYVSIEGNEHYPMYSNQIKPYFTSVRLDVSANQHYQTAVQPIETMQANMTREELIGFLKGNIIKYVCRCGRKDDVTKETAKIKQYAEWLNEVANGRKIIIEYKEDK